ncbi:hypothetical protein JCM10212_001007 [Sporobolomyces blumeae]
MSIPRPRQPASLWTTRLHDRHYYLNSLLCLAFPAALVLDAAHVDLSLVWTVGVWSTPLLVLLGLSSARAHDLESVHASLTFQLRLLNLFALVLARHHLSSGLVPAVLYSLAWFLTSFTCPQPSYLAHHHLERISSSDEFDREILLIPSARSAALEFVNAPLSAYDRDRDDDDDDDLGSTRPIGSRETWNLVLFHVDWSAKSRQLERTLARLSST